MTSYRFGPFGIESDQRRLQREGEPVALGQRAFDVLLALVQRPGRLVTKEELLELAWPGVVVEENNLQVQISALRKVLGNAAIATIPGRGYRFTLPVASVGSNTPIHGASHNLPRLLTSFVGHEQDLDEYAALLADTRLLTLTGIGGCGKTRVGVKLAERLLQSFRDGVRYIDMAPLLDAERVPLTIATALGIPAEGESDVVATLCNRLADRRMLIVVDNCEHVVSVCAAVLQQMISAATGVQVLAASREALGIPGERVVTVRSLSFPPAAAKPTAQAVADCEAVRLFVERAQLPSPKFALSDDNAGAVAEICRRLDGIPLAIELAAARVNVLSVEEIRGRLDDRFRLLTGGSKTALGRQQTLLAAMQWSYDHLEPGEQQLLRRLSVFVGGWTLAGAVRIAGEPADEYAVLELLARLVDQSLVGTQTIDGATRYSMLETVRQYAQQRLQEEGEGEAARERHLEFYVAFAERAASELVGPDQRTWFARLEPELENLLAAHRWCEHAERHAVLGLRLVFALKHYLMHRGLTALGHQIAVEALARRGAQAPGVARCRALLAAGELAYFTGGYSEARELAEAGLAIAQAIGEPESVADAFRLFGYADFGVGDHAMAHEHLHASLVVARKLQDRQQLSRTVNALGVLHSATREPHKAQPMFEEALALNRERGDLGSVAINLSNVASVSLKLGMGERARALLREGFAIAAAIGSRRAGALQLSVTTELAVFCRDWTFAARMYGATEHLSERSGSKREPVNKLVVDPQIAETRAALGPAAFAEAESAGHALFYEDAVAEAIAWLESPL